MADLLSKRLVFVTGKGGVGKTTVAGALGLAAARQGRRVVVAEVGGQDRLHRALTGRPAHRPEHEVEAAPGLWTVTVDPQQTSEDYIARELPVRAVADMLSGSRMFQYFTAATPGMSELLTIGKVWDLGESERKTRGTGKFDLVIVDAPATGHGLALLRAPSTFADIARVGPVNRQGRAIERTLRDPAQTGVVVVALPAEAPIAEALTIDEALPEITGRAPDLFVVNGLRTRHLGEKAARTLRAALPDAPERARAALQAAVAEEARSRHERAQVKRLAKGTGADPVGLPFLPVPEVRAAELEALADVLEKVVT